MWAQTTDYAGFIRRAFMDEGLMGTVAKLPLERKFKLEHVKEVGGLLALLHHVLHFSHASQQQVLSSLRMVRACSVDFGSKAGQVRACSPEQKMQP